MATSESISTKPTYKRILGKVHGTEDGPTVIFIAGIHGNEKAGVLALQHIFPVLEAQKNNLAGSVIGIAGNLEALDKGVRFNEEDLNRLWTPEVISRLLKAEESQRVEEQQLIALYKVIMEVLDQHKPPFYIIDLHTTSGPTCPFILINDSLLNRSFISQYSYPIILGIEEHLGSTLLSFLNELGYVSFGFESGQHYDPLAVDHAIHFIQNTLQLTNSLPNEIPRILGPLPEQVEGDCEISGFFEIYHLHKIKKGDSFKMIPGFRNFEQVPAGVELATANNEVIATKKNIQLFMPLYQDKGSSGFYFIRRIPKLFLHISKWLRIFRSDRILVLLPGINWGSENRDTLLVNLKVARFMAKQFFHLLGYRAREVQGNILIVKNRERGSKNKDYRNESWY